MSFGFKGTTRPHRFVPRPGVGMGDKKTYGTMFVAGPCGTDLKVLFSKNVSEAPEDPAWEHVSVSTKKRIPNWLEMDFCKDLFWDDTELVVQFHVPKVEHVNVHTRVLHLWRHPTATYPLPPKHYV